MTDPQILQLLDHDDEDDDDGQVYATPEQVRNAFIQVIPGLGDKLLELERRLEREEGLRRLFALRLRRPLTEPEALVLLARLADLGIEALEERVLDSTAETLETWLAE